MRTVSSRKEMFCAQLELPYEFLFAEPLPETSEVVGLEPEEVEEPNCKRAKTIFEQILKKLWIWIEKKFVFFVEHFPFSLLIFQKLIDLNFQKIP